MIACFTETESVREVREMPPYPSIQGPGLNLRIGREGEPQSRTTQPETIGKSWNPKPRITLRIVKRIEEAAKPGNDPSPIHHMPASSQLNLISTINSLNIPNLKSDLKQQEPR